MRAVHRVWLDGRQIRLSDPHLSAKPLSEYTLPIEVHHSSAPSAQRWIDKKAHDPWAAEEGGGWLRRAQWDAALYVTSLAQISSGGCLRRMRWPTPLGSSITSADSGKEL